MPADPLALLRSRSYLALLALAAIIGAPVPAACGFLALISKMQGWRPRRPPRPAGAPARASATVAAVGSFAWISTLFGSAAEAAPAVAEADPAARSAQRR